ncbi:MAG: hypothetical protein H6Q42_3939 [Deltaproteobacteria bacterium]|nr:hypothetical protein [Deltaproteobacteria bacterium]
MNMLIEKKLKQAVHYHQAGNFRQAQNLYREVLVFDPQNPDAYPLLGLAASGCAIQGFFTESPLFPSSSSAEAGRDIEVDVDDGV